MSEIDKYYDTDKDYYQTLMTIYHQINPDDLDKFFGMLADAENENKRISINEDNLIGNWDSLSLGDLIVK